MLIGAVANQRILSMYEFSVVVSSASTTHLAKLDALREYFLEHSVVNFFAGQWYAEPLGYTDLLSLHSDACRSDAGSPGSCPVLPTANFYKKLA